MKGRLIITLLLACTLCLGLATTATAVTEITVMMGAPPATQPDILKEIIAKFEKAHPDIKVNYVQGADQKVLTAIASGLIPDAATINNSIALNFFKSGSAYDITPFIKADNFDTTQIPPNYDSMMYNGRWYGMPQAGGAFADRAIFYNKDMFSAAGLAEPNYRWTWEQFGANVQKLSFDVQNDGVFEQTGYTFSALEWPIYVWSGGGDIFNASLTEFMLNKEAAVNALTFWSDLTRRGFAQFPLAANAFTQGKTAMRTGAFFEAKADTVNITFDWSILEFPRGLAGSINRCVTHPWVIPVDAKHPKEAWEWIKFWLSDEIQLDLVLKYAWRPAQTVSAARQLARTRYDKPPYTYAPFMGINSTAKQLPPLTNWNEINTIIVNALAPVWKGEQSVLGAMNAIENKVMALTK